VTLPLLDPNIVMLAARVAKTFTKWHRLAFGQLAPDLTFTLASPNLRTLAQQPLGDLIGQRLPEVFWEFVGAEAALQAVLQGAEAEFQLICVNRDLPNGETQFLNFNVTRSDPGTGLILIVEDVSATARVHQQVLHGRNELRLAKAELAQAVNQLAYANTELERLNHFKSFLLAMAAHDFSSPLTVIQVNVSRLQKDPPPEIRRKLLAVTRSQVNQLTRLVTNLLNLDKIEQGRLTLNRMRYDLVGLVREAMDTLEPLAQLREVTLKAALPAQAVPIYADADAVRQILLNLGSNAVKYTPSGGHIQIDVQPEAGLANFTILNTGPGLTPEQMARLFQPYYRAGNDPATESVGSGLGLFIVKTLVEAHSGTVTVSSQPGQDVTFTMCLPLATTDERG
jgi:signal transduction histidine kinase